MAKNETKLASYHNTPFDKICLGMTKNDVTNWIRVNYTATSLYSVIADDNYHKTNAGRAEWISLINGAELQSNCNKEGFNVRFGFVYPNSIRIGIAGNNENDCESCDSSIGFGVVFTYYRLWKWSSGSILFHPNKTEWKTFGYIFVQ